MKNIFVWYTIGTIIFIQSTILHAPTIPKYEVPTERHTPNIELNTSIKASPINQTGYKYSSLKKGIHESTETTKISQNGMPIPNQKPPQSPIKKTDQTRTISQQTTDQLGNIFRPENRYTTTDPLTGAKRIETRNKQGDILSARIEQPNGSYTIYDATKPGRIIEEKYTDGTIAKDFKYDQSGNLTQATIYKQGVFTPTFVGIKKYSSGNEKAYTIKDKTDKTIEVSSFDPIHNSQTINKYDLSKPALKNITSTEIITNNNRTFINEQSGTRTITTNNGQKVTIQKDGSYMIETGNNKVSVQLPDNFQENIIIDSTTNPGTTTISLKSDSKRPIITIGKNPENPSALLIMENFQNQQPRTTSIQKDGTIYTIQKNGTAKIEIFNGKTTIKTESNQNQEKATITTANNQQIVVTQKDFILTIQKSPDQGILNTGLFTSKPKTITINFSSYLQALRKAKTTTEQAKIIDDMTIKLTENSDLIKTTEYQKFKESIIQEINTTIYTNNKPTELFTTQWFSYFYKQLFAQYYKLKTTEAEINATKALKDAIKPDDIIPTENTVLSLYDYLQF